METPPSSRTGSPEKDTSDKTIETPPHFEGGTGTTPPVDEDWAPFPIDRVLKPFLKSQKISIPNPPPKTKDEWIKLVRDSGKTLADVDAWQTSRDSAQDSQDWTGYPIERVL
jgi:hypothetical protein